MYDYQIDGETRRKFSVAHVVRPRTQTSNACLCLTLMSKVPDQKPWQRSISARDPSRGILLDLREDYSFLSTDISTAFLNAELPEIRVVVVNPLLAFTSSA